jgi:hypothetical protein
LPDADQVPDVGDFITAASANGYGLYDQCGNVHEWVQDRYASSPNDRAVRGGSFEDGVVWVGTQARSSAAASMAWGSIGLRVVRVIQQPGDADGDIGGDDYDILYGCLSGPGGGLLSSDCGLVISTLTATWTWTTSRPFRR